MNKTALLNNRYQFISTLGRGGFGETFLATDTHLPSGKKCVIKQLKPIIQEPQIPQWMQDRFQQEARILERLGDQHSQIPRLYAYFAEGGNFYLVQEWIDGITLTDKVANEGTLSEKEVQKILVNILPVLDYVHRQRIVHRDLKPDNIILRHGDNMPVLIDFGAMKEAMTTVYNNHSSSAYSMAIGTPGYMSPEQAAGRPIYSSDLYSLALTAVYLLTAKSPQYLKTDSRTGELLWREAAPNLHSTLATVLDRTIRFHPGDRFSSAKEMLAALQQSTFNSTSVTVTHNEKVSNNSPQTEFTEKKTIVVKPEEPQEGKNFFKPLFLIASLVLVALGGFAFGFKVLLNQNPPQEIANQPDEETFPPDTNNTPIAQENTPQPQPQSQPQGEIQPQPQEEVQPQPQLQEQVQPQPQPQEQVQPQGEVQPEIPPNEQEKSEEEKRAEELQREQEKRAEELQREQEKRAEELQREQEKQSATSINVPIIKTGTSESEILSKLGQPSSRSRGYWGDSTALLYRDAIPNQVDLGYLIENNTGKLRQTEVSFSTSLDLPTMQNTLAGLLGGDAPPVVAEALRQVYQGETNLRSFNTGNFKGMIERQEPDRIYIGVWDPDFH
jgi:serine/threonine-protein kinase